MPQASRTGRKTGHWPLTRGAPSDHHRELVRSEYYDAVDMPDNTHATMYRDDRYKLVVYHGHDLGELYDMQVAPTSTTTSGTSRTGRR